MAEDKMGIGTIKFYKADTKTGVIAPHGAAGSPDEQKDLYFEAKDAKKTLRPFRVGQLVEFVEVTNGDDRRAKSVGVLSEKA